MAAALPDPLSITLLLSHVPPSVISTRKLLHVCTGHACRHFRGSAVATDCRDYDKYQREKQDYERRVAAKQVPLPLSPCYSYS
jgi:hypothetical protein